MKKKHLLIATSLLLITVLSTSAAFANTSAVSADKTANKSTTCISTSNAAIVQKTAAEREQCNSSRFSAALTALVTADTITAAQKIAVENALKSITPVRGENSFKTALDALATAGTITAAQETSIIKALDPSRSDRCNKGGFTSALGALVNAGTITADQKTAIVNALRSNEIVKGENGLKTALDTLVAAGTITAVQETSIINALDAGRSHQPNMGWGHNFTNEHSGHAFAGKGLSHNSTGCK